MTLTQLSSLNTLYENFIVMLYFHYFTYGAELLNTMIESNKSSQKKFLTKLEENACVKHKEIIKQTRENIDFLQLYFKDYKNKLIRRIENSEDEYIHFLKDKSTYSMRCYRASVYCVDKYLDLTSNKVLLCEVAMQVNLIEDVYK